ncbi:MAG: 5'-nucleotidase domain-containing protein [Candidatus Latescibacterota bacterium]
MAAANPDNRLYVNQLLDVSDIDVVGFDLDHTLAVYDAPAVNALAFRETARFLVDIKGYPGGLADLDYQDSAVTRGLVADPDRGYLVKLDLKDRVRRAGGPEGFMPAGLISEIYGEEPLAVDGHYQIRCPFDLPAGVLFTASLRLLPRSGGPAIEQTLKDVAEMLDRSHRFGNLKQTITADAARYIARRPGLDRLIAGFRDRGKKTAVLTNSELEYAVHVLDHLFPCDGSFGGWKGLFDAVVVDASKPRFFDAAGTVPAKRVIETRPGSPGVWTGGNARDWERFFDTPPDRILYIGDNPVADCIAARHRGWRTALVVPEIASDPQPPHAPDPAQQVSFDSWGSLFWENGEPTRFSRVLREMPDLFAARLEHILTPGPEARFIPA